MTKTALITIIIASALNCRLPLSFGNQEKSKAIQISGILEELNRSAEKLTSYQCKIRYKYSQPLFESQTIREGRLYYLKKKQQSLLRINFDTLKLDDEKPEKKLEQYIFDGVWLTHIDYQLKQIKKYQQSEPNQPMEVFELASRHFPIIGFSNPSQLSEEFDITLPSKQPEDQIHLRMMSRPNSIYSEQYKTIEFRADKSTHLPSEITSISCEGDIYEINLLNAKVNQKIAENTFRVKIPEDFGKPEIYLKED